MAQRNAPAGPEALAHSRNGPGDVQPYTPLAVNTPAPGVDAPMVLVQLNQGLQLAAAPGTPAAQPIPRAKYANYVSFRQDVVGLATGPAMHSSFWNLVCTPQDTYRSLPELTQLADSLRGVNADTATAILEPMGYNTPGWFSRNIGGRGDIAQEAHYIVRNIDTLVAAMRAHANILPHVASVPGMSPLISSESVLPVRSRFDFIDETDEQDVPRVLAVDEIVRFNPTDHTGFTFLNFWKNLDYPSFMTVVSHNSNVTKPKSVLEGYLHTFEACSGTDAKWDYMKSLGYNDASWFTTKATQIRYFEEGLRQLVLNAGQQTISYRMYAASPNAFQPDFNNCHSSFWDIIMQQGGIGGRQIRSTGRGGDGVQFSSRQSGHINSMNAISLGIHLVTLGIGISRRFPAAGAHLRSVAELTELLARLDSMNDNPNAAMDLLKLRGYSPTVTVSVSTEIASVKNNLRQVIASLNNILTTAKAIA